MFTSAESEYRVASQFSRPACLLRGTPDSAWSARNAASNQKSILDILPMKLLDDEDLKAALSGLGSKQTAVSDEWQETMQCEFFLHFLLFNSFSWFSHFGFIEYEIVGWWGFESCVEWITLFVLRNYAVWDHFFRILVNIGYFRVGN